VISSLQRYSTNVIFISPVKPGNDDKLQVAIINEAIDYAADDEESSLYNIAHVQDPSDEIIEVLIQAMEWSTMSRRWNIRVSDLPELHKRSVLLLDTLKANLPEKSGETNAWNFEKAHSILHKVREILYWGWSENTSCQSPEHAHGALIKAVGNLTNNKDIFLCILRFHARSGCLQQHENLLQDLSDLQEENNNEEVESINEIDRNYNLACETGLRYPSLQAMFDRKNLTCRISVSMNHIVHSWFNFTLRLLH
jgi:hypothetical protein